MLAILCRKTVLFLKSEVEKASPESRLLVATYGNDKNHNWVSVPGRIYVLIAKTDSVKAVYL